MRDFMISRTYAGMEVFETATAVKRTQDWSKCRSPARASRRLKRGFPQHMVEREEPCAIEIQGKLFIHQDLYRELMKRVSADIMERADSDFLGSMMGGRR